MINYSDNKNSMISKNIAKKESKKAFWMDSSLGDLNIYVLT